MAVKALVIPRLASSSPIIVPLCIRRPHLYPLQMNRNPGNVILIGRLLPISHAMLSHKMSPAGKFLCLVTKCSQDKELAKKKCVPCDSNNLKPMSIKAAEELLQKIPGWNILNEDGKQRLHRDWKVKNFMKGLEFFKHVADVAEAEGGLTENDFILAAKISSLDLESLLRIKRHERESFTAS